MTKSTAEVFDFATLISLIETLLTIEAHQVTFSVSGITLLTHKHRVIIPEENVFAWEKKRFVATVSIRDIKVAKSKTSAVLLVNNRRLIRRKFNES